MTDTTLDTSKTQAVGTDITDNIESLNSHASAKTESLLNTRSALILKSQKISISQIPDAHQKARDLINPESVDTDSDTAMSVIRHYCAVEGLTGGRNAITMPAEIFTVIYEFTDSSTDVTTNQNTIREVRVQMLSTDYGIVDSHIKSGAIELGVDRPPAKPAFYRNPRGELVVVPVPEDGPNGFKDLKLNHTIAVYVIIHNMVRFAPGYGNSVRSSWSAGVRVSLVGVGNNDSLIDNYILKFFHFQAVNEALLENGKVEVGDYLGMVGRSGMMDPLNKEGKDQFPHTHIEVVRWRGRKQKKYNPRRHLAKVCNKHPLNKGKAWDYYINSGKGGNVYAPAGFAEFGQKRAAGTSHGGLDIGALEGTKIYSPIKGKVIGNPKKTVENYLKNLKKFREVLAAHNKKVKEEGYIYRFRGKDGYTYSIPFAKGQTITLGPNDWSLETHVAGKKAGFMRAERKR